MNTPSSRASLKIVCIQENVTCTLAFPGGGIFISHCHRNPLLKKTCFMRSCCICTSTATDIANREKRECPYANFVSGVHIHHMEEVIFLEVHIGSVSIIVRCTHRFCFYHCAMCTFLKSPHTYSVCRVGVLWSVCIRSIVCCVSVCAHVDHLLRFCVIVGERRFRTRRF